MSRRSHTRSTDVAWTGVLAGLSAAAAVVVSAALCARSKARVAEMARTKAAQLEAERARHAKDDLLASVSHELRTPLNAIVGWAYMLRLPTLSDPQPPCLDRTSRGQIW